MTTNKLTKKQEKIFTAIIRYITSNKLSPTRQELAKITGERSINGVNQKIRQLQTKGYIKIHPPKTKRNITISKNPYEEKGLFE
jgi:SOS-response transcriptional repressor LexA